MATPTSRQELKVYACRSLGFPVIGLNLDDEQLDDRLDDVLNIWQNFAVDGTLKVYATMNVSQNNINTQSFQMSSNTINVTRIFPILGSVTGSNGPQDFNIFDLNYQLRLNELYDFTSADYVYYELAQQHIRTLELLFIGEPPIRYNRYENVLYVDGLKQLVVPGSKVVAECYQILGEDNTLFWNDVWVKKYTTCLFKRQWGNNLKKFDGTTLPGGVKLNGQQIYNEAVMEQEKLELELRQMYEQPIPHMIG